MKAKKIFMSLLAAGCLSVACFAEAASVALLPLIDYSGNEDAEGINTTYTTAAIRSINDVEGFTLVDSDALTAVLDKNLPEGVLPDAAAMRKIAQEANVDVVFAMKLDKLTHQEIYTHVDEYMLLDMQGRVVFYNALTGKYKSVRILDESKEPLDNYTRDNFELHKLSDAVRHEMHRALGNKKIKAEKPSFGW